MTDLNKVPPELKKPTELHEIHAYVEFQQMVEWIQYVVRSQALAKYILASAAGFMTFNVTIANSVVVDTHNGWLYWISFALICIAILSSSICLIDLMRIEARLSERLVEDGTDINVNQEEFSETYFSRRWLRISLVLLFLGIALFLVELSLTNSQNWSVK